MWWSLLFSIPLFSTHTHTLNTLLCLTSCFQPPLRVTFREESMPERQRRAKHCGKRVERSNESPPDGLLLGIATHLWLCYSRCRGNSSAYWKLTILLLRRITVDIFFPFVCFCGFFLSFFFWGDLNSKSQTPCSQYSTMKNCSTKLRFGFYFIFICLFKKIETGLKHFF